MELPLELVIAWRHLRVAARPRWVRPMLAVAATMLVLGLAAMVLDVTLASTPADPVSADAVVSPMGLWGLAGLGVALLACFVLAFALLSAYLNLLSGLIIVSVGVGCTALVVVLSLMGGLGHELQGKILGQEGHIRIVDRNARNFGDHEAVLAAVGALPEVAGVGPALVGEIMVRSDYNRLGVRLVGIDPERHRQATELPARLESGSYAFLQHPEHVPIYGPVGGPEPIESPSATDLGAEPARPTPSIATPPDDDPVPEEDDDGGWEDPAVEMGFSPAPDTARGSSSRPDQGSGPDDGWGDADNGWEDPGVEIARLRAAGHLPPAPAPESVTRDEPVAEFVPPGTASAPPPQAPDLVVSSSAEPVLDPVVIGRELAAELGVRVGMSVQLITPVGRMTPAGEVPGLMAARIAGVFYARQYEYDSGYVYAPLDRVQALLRAPGRVTHLEVRLRDPEAIETGAAALRAVLDQLGRDDLEVRDWRETHRNLFSAMFIEKAAMSVALLFVILVAAFGILATSLMAVLERAPEIAILKAMGITDRRIARVFVAESLLLGVMGSVGGTLAGLALCAIGRRVGLPVDESIYYIQQLPLVVRPGEVAMVGLCAIAIVWLSCVYPARAAAKLRPVTALRALD